MEFVAQADGKSRVYGYRVLERYPFYVLAGLSEEDVMGFWLQRALMIGILGATLLACLMVVMLGLFRAQKRERLVAAQLRRHGEQLNAAQRIAQLGSWEILLPSKQVRCSDELYRIFDIEQREGEYQYQDFFERVHPDDRQVVDQRLGDSITSGLPVSLKHRLLLPDGRIKYVLESCETEYGKDGAPTRVIGT